MSGYRPPYTLDEDVIILKVIVQTKCFYVLKGTLFWKDMSNLGLLDRTWHSLKQRFFKEIVPNLFTPNYDIPEFHKRMIILGLDQTGGSNSECD